MNILITGGSGFVGSNLSNYFIQSGQRVCAVSRSPGSARIRHEDYTYISADTTQPGEWQNALEKADAVVNLAGTTIFKRWSASYKQLIYDSRILTTRNVVDALEQMFGIGSPMPVEPPHTTLQFPLITYGSVAGEEYLAVTDLTAH